MSSLRWCLALLLCVGLADGEIKNKGWWKNTVFYQVYPRSFMDANGDGIGDLKGITSKLEHFKDAGIGAIWLSPIYASPMVDFGYDISDFRKIDENYGTMADLEELTKKAKELGIKIIMDLVPNHTSDKHQWFIDAMKGNPKYTKYYVLAPGKDVNKPPNNWISVFSNSAWKYIPDLDLWYFHQFEYRQPDLNYVNKDVQKEMEEIITFWLDKGIDGFRIDAVPHLYEDDELKDEPKSNTPGAVEGKDYTYLDHIYTKDDPRTYDLVKSWRAVVDKYADEKNQDEKVILTEAYTSLVNTTKYYNYGSHVPFNFNFIMNVNVASKPSEFKKVIEDWMASMPEGGVANWVMGNHDRSRTATRYPGRADQMTMLAMILPGIAVTYNGEEIAMEDKLDITWEETKDPQACNAGKEHYKEQSRDPNRTPFQWDDTTNAGFSTAKKTWIPVHSNYKTLNLAKQKKDAVSHYKLYQKLTELRNNEALQTGSLEVQITNEDVLAVIRYGINETVTLLINFQDSTEKVVDLGGLTRNHTKHTAYVSSIGSKTEWGSTLDPTAIKLQAKESLVLISRNSAFSVGPLKVILSVTLYALYTLL